MEQGRLEESIDELYAIQKQAGERFIELTRENQWILEKLERKVVAHTDELVRYSKIYLGTLVVVNILGIWAMLWMFNSFNNEFKKQLARVELVADTSIIMVRDSLKELKKIKK
jgi:hypothetical protein